MWREKCHTTEISIDDLENNHLVLVGTRIGNE